MAGLWVWQACGVLLLPGFGVSSSSPQVPGHPTSIGDTGVNATNSCLQDKEIFAVIPQLKGIVSHLPHVQAVMRDRSALLFMDQSEKFYWTPDLYRPCLAT